MEMITVSLEAFVRTGSFGPVQLGMSRAQIQELFGPPVDVGCRSRKYPRPVCWFYGDVELHFQQREDVLWLIHLEDFQVPTAEGNLQLDPWIFRGAMPRAEVEQQLTACGIAFQQITGASQTTTTTLIAGARVQLLFSNHVGPYDPPPGLFALGRQ
jgi:hypothetical protein